MEKRRGGEPPGLEEPRSEPGSRLRRGALLALLALAVTALANAAWLYGLASLPDDARLSGLHVLNATDTPTYLGWIDQARRGEWLFRQLYTTEAHERSLFHPLFLAIGAGARALGLSNVGAYHGARVLLGLLLVPLAYGFFAAALPGTARRLAALLILLFAAGLGWLWRLAGAGPGSLPIDVWMPEAFVFMSLVESPLNLAAFALWAVVGSAALRFLGRGGAGTLAAAAAATALLVSMRPHSGAGPACALAVLGCGVSVWSGRASRGRGLALALAIFAGVGLGLVGPLYALLFGDVLAGWRGQVLGAAPEPWRLVVGLAWPLGLAALGVRPALARAGPAGPWLVTWVAAVLLLLTLPVGPQSGFARKMVEALPLPLAALAGEGVVSLLRLDVRTGRARRRAWAVFALGLALASISNASLLWRDARAFAERRSPQVFADCFAEALDALAERVGPDDVILAPVFTAILLPGYTGATVVCCHYDQTLDSKRKQGEVRGFYTPGAAPRRRLLRRYGVDYVVLRPEDELPAELEGLLVEAIRTDCLRIYRVGSAP